MGWWLVEQGTFLGAGTARCTVLRAPGRGALLPLLLPFLWPSGTGCAQGDQALGFSR